MDIKYTDRTSYDGLNLMGDVGGVLEIIVIVFHMMSMSFSILRIKAIVTSRMFRLSAENTKAIFGQANLSEKQVTNHYLKKSSTGEITIGVPHYLIWEYIKHLCCRLCLKNRNFTEYEEII